MRVLKRVLKPGTAFAAAVAFVALSVSILMWPQSARPDESVRLLPDLGGELQSVVLVVNSARRSALRNAEVITHIVNALSSETNCFLMTNDREAFAVAQDAMNTRVRFFDLPRDRAFTIWPQDPFIVLTGDGGGRRGDDQLDDRIRLLVSRSFERVDDRFLVESLAEQAAIVYDTSSLVFEGGNIVSDERVVFVGGNTIRRNSNELKIPEAEVVRRFERELGRRILVVGRAPQAIAHLDMMLTPIGQRRVVVADATAGAELAADDLRNDPEAVLEFERSCEYAFFGNPQITEVTTVDGTKLRYPSMVGRASEAIAYSRSVGKELDRIAEGLRHSGYSVRRVPILKSERVADVNKINDAANDASPVIRLNYPTLTYNNVLVETRGGRDVVYLPRYGWEALDTAARSTWQNLGFEVHSVDGLAVSAIYGGSLRCCVKVLQRRNRANPED